MRSLRICLIKSAFHTYGGLEKYCLRLIKALAEQGHQTTLLSTADRPDLSMIKVCRRLRSSTLNMVWFDLHCRYYLRKAHFDVVIGFDRHFLPLSLYRAGNGCHKAYLDRRMKGAPWYRRLLLSCSPFHWLTRLSERVTFEWSPPCAVVCNSYLVKQEIQQYYPGTPADRLFVVHNGVEWHELEPFFCEKMGQPRSPQRPAHLLFIGNGWKRKGLDRLLQALALIPDHPFHLTGVGSEQHGEWFVQYAKELGIGHKVTLLPCSHSCISLYQSADIMVIPSLYDPFANVTVEALAMGLYVITTKANGGSELVQPGCNGEVLEENPSDLALSRAIANALSLIADPLLPYTIRKSVKESDFSRTMVEYVRLVERVACSNY